MLRHTRKAIHRIVLGSLLGFILAWVLFRDTEWNAIYAALKNVNLSWIVLSQIFLLASHLFRVQRWTQIIRVSHPLRYRPVFSAAQLGFLSNVILPMRLGEGLRAMILSRLAKIRLSTSLGFVVLDRATDALALLAVSLVTLLAFPLDRDIELPSGTFGNVETYTLSAAVLKPLTVGASLILAVLLLFLILLYWKRTFILRLCDRYTAFLPRRISTRIAGVLEGFTAGMEFFSSGPQMLRAILLSLIAWGCSALSLAAIITAFSLNFEWYVPFAMVAMIAFFVAAPLAPGLIGQFHLAVIVCLLIAVPGVSLSETRALALATHFLSLLPVFVLGLWALLLERRALLGNPLLPTVEAEV